MVGDGETFLAGRGWGGFCIWERRGSVNVPRVMIYFHSG